jgi:glucose-1-phosphate adenylyltransferase
MKKVAGLIINSSNQLDLDELVQHRSIHTIPIGGKFRLIDFSLSNLVNMTRDLYVGVIGSYNYRSLIDHLKQGQDWNLSRKSNDLLILQGDRSTKVSQFSRISVQDFIDNKGFFEKLSDNIEQIVISGTNIIGNIDMAKALEEHKENEAEITMLYKKGYQGEISNKEIRLTVEDHDVKKLLYGQGDDCDSGRDVFVDSLVINKDKFMNMLKEAEHRGVVDFIELIEQCIGQCKVKAYSVPGYVKIINSLQSYYECSMDLLKSDVYKELFKQERKIYTKSKDNHPTVYGTDAKVKNAFVASGAVVNGSLETSIVFRNAKIGKGAKIKNSIIMQGAKVEDDAVVVNAIVDKNAVVHSGEFITSSTKEPILIKRRKR